MDRNQIKDYILQYKDSYSKEEIKNKLVSAGALENEVNQVYQELTNDKSGLALGLAIAGWFIPLVGIVLFILAIIYGHKARKINKNNKTALAALIIGYIGAAILPLLILGALIFSFVDFGSLVPNKVELNNNFRGSATESFVSKEFNFEDNVYDEAVILVFTYTGAKAVEVPVLNHEINSNLDMVCSSTLVKNVNTDTSITCQPDSLDCSENIAFRNGQTGIMIFNCDEELIANDVLEGQIQINYLTKDTLTPLSSSGPIRLTVIG